MADNESSTSAPPIQYSDGHALLANGSEALHSHLSKRIEIALGKALPQMEVRFKDLSISVDMLLEKHDQHDTPASDLPTISHELKNGLRKLGKASKHQTTRHILQNLNGSFKPGTLTLVLGQPGSGKSALMKILSGRFPMSKQVHVNGEITYNGTPREEISKRLPQFVNYVTQRDYHFPTLTVKETLAFAHECCGAELPARIEALLSNGNPQENQAAIEAMQALYKHKPDLVLQSLGLEHCQDTIVGNSMLRGVSGGERKRVTTGEMEFSAKFVSFMDEISTGLDSAATYDIIKTQRSLAQKFRRTVVIALLQPSPEVFHLFDEVLLLNKGRVMYHGPRDQVVEYFQHLGFVCPPRRDHADFLLDLGTPQQHQYEVKGTDALPPRTPREFAELFSQSVIHQEKIQQLHGPHDPLLLQDNLIHFKNIPEFHQSFIESTQTLIKRQLKITLRNTAFIKGRSIMVIVMGFFYSTVFWQVNPENAQVAMGIMFAAVLFLALGQASQIPTFMAAREIFYKQRGANFFRTSSYVLANSVSQLPLAMIETFVFGTMVYWMCGFVPSIVSYILFLTMLFLTNLAFASSFFCLSALAPDLHIAKPLSLVMIMFFIIFAGFIIPANQIPDYFIWAYWMNPIAWCLRSLAINQYRSDRFNVQIYKGINYYQRFGMEMGEYSLSVFDIQTEKMWLWYGMMFMIASYILFMTLSYFVLEYKRYESPEHSNLTDDVDSQGTEASYVLVTSPHSTSSHSTKELVLQVDTTQVRSQYFIPVTVAFRDLWYSVPNPTSPKETFDLLKGISGYAAPGTITALMGSSGAGKTTLMDVIAGRKTGGQIRGEILLNGYAATDLAIRRCTGYCEQMDIHSEASTIREALTFSAFLRQGSDVPDSQKYDTVEECLELLDMGAIADQIIRGSSVEQMKRLTIGVELAAQPSVLFLDEPTSGLDARSAKVIMDGVRKVANTGRTVLCTIHQPSSEVFQVFDSLLLLKRGGETVYFGELGTKSSALIEYFEAMEGVTPLEDGYNPATWMLEVIGAGVGNTHKVEIDFVKAFKSSDKMRSLTDNLAREGVSRPAVGSTPLDFKRKRAATEATQAKFLMKRFINMYWRTPSYNLTRMIVCIVLALLFGFAFLDGKYDTYQGINAGQGLVFITTIFVGVVAFNSVLPIASEERAAFYRERASQTYNALWYFVGITLIEIPYVAVSSFVFCGILYPMVGFGGFTRFFYYWLNTAMHVLLQTYAGQLLAFAMPSVEVAAIIGVLMNSIFFLFMGFNPPAAAIPSSYKWLYHITPQRYTLEILSGIVFGNCPTNHDSTYLGCKPLKGKLPPNLPANITIKEYAKEVFLVNHDNMWIHFTFILGSIILFRILALLSLRYINHQKR